MIKRFFEWIKIKQKLDEKSEEIIPFFKHGQIWWANIGENIGTETSGKNEAFTRPVLILRKWDDRSFFAVPLTSREKIGSWYFPIYFRSKMQSVVLNQGRTLSTKRLEILLGELNKEDLKKIKASVSRLLSE